MIRCIAKDDFAVIHRIWERYYQEEFPFPDFLNNYICAFTVEDEDGEFILAGGVRTIAEGMFITNKDMPIRDRIKGAHEIFEAFKFVTARSGFHNLNAFVSDPAFRKYLINKVGFKKEEILSLGL